MNGRLVLAGFDPAEVEFRLVVDMSWALLIEVYREFGMKFEEAMDELNGRLADGPTAPPAQTVRRRAPDNQASMAMLQAMMGDTNFKGPRG